MWFVDWLEAVLLSSIEAVNTFSHTYYDVRAEQRDRHVRDRRFCEAINEIAETIYEPKESSREDD